MFRRLIIYNILFTAYIQGSTVPAPKISENTEQKQSQPETVLSKLAVSEGGAIVTKPLTLRNNTQNVLLNSENDLIMNKESPVHPRKGVDFNSTEDINQQDKIEHNLVSTQNISVISNAVTSLPNNNISQQLANNTVHKPLILSHEALEESDKLSNVDLNKKGPDIKVHTMKTNSHPGMIMPIVITILVVPMFAVVGYMALKRGKEAWKNRHYKRMDFLLDGMYND